MLWLAAQQAVAGITSYHIGNSLTWDSQPLGIEAIASLRGDDLTTGYHIKSASSLNNIIENPDTVDITPAAPFGKFSEALPNHPWNAVTMQPHPGLTSTMATDVTSILHFIDLAQTNPANANTTFYIYSAWPTQGNYQEKWTAPVADLDSTPTINARDYGTHLINRVRAATDAKVNMIPVGEVLYELDVRMQAGLFPGFTSIDQFHRDSVHLSYSLGRYVAGVTTYATIFGKDPAGFENPADFYAANDPAYSPEVNAAIYDAVWDVVSTHFFAGVFSVNADFDGSGFITDADLAVWEASFGLDAGADANGDGNSDGEDFLAWQRQFGYSAPSLAATTSAVPEPSTLFLLLSLVILNRMKTFATSRGRRSSGPRLGSTTATTKG